jgi:type IV fimbrial biogenesis protein FimT
MPIRAAAESIVNGLQRARAEAVVRNTDVQFVLGAGSSWVVSVVSDGAEIDKRSSAEGSLNVTRAVVPADATTITFNNLGAVGVQSNQPLNADGTAPFTQIALASAGGGQNMQVTIGVGGNARMCDPSLATGSSPRAC